MNELTLICALIIGLSLGIFGSGGAILTLPTLIYFLHLPEKQAVIGSLYIVALIALFTAIPHIRSRRVSPRHLFYFALPGLASSYLGAWSGSVVPSWVQLTVFVFLMMLAAVKMLLSRPNEEPSLSEATFKLLPVLIAGVLVGFATGFVGVGGGFLIVPALFFLTRLPIDRAMATSIVIIFLQSSMGLVAYVQHATDVVKALNWSILSLVAVIGVIGAYSGLFIVKKLDQAKLTKGFGIFLLSMAMFLMVDRVLF